LHKLESNFHFKVMAFIYKLRDLLSRRKSIIEEVGIQQGFRVLDYGCGPGSYLTPLAELVGNAGKIYALDVHLLVVQMVQNAASRKRLENVETILSDCKTGLPNNSVDVILLYDTFHDLSDQNGVLEELHRILKPNGILSFSDHHMNDNEILSKVTNRGLFKMLRKGKKTYSFLKEEAAGSI